ncbi:MAG: hypothetical protein IAG13_29475 [Deltaproteobacteria bacterium]|nr:hypothetical protein [Nannocystaceae bacterium]
MVATADGDVLWSRRRVGEYWTPAAGAVLVLGDLRRLQVRIEIDEIDADALRPRAHCELRSDGGEPLGSGRAVRVAPELGSRALLSERPSLRSDARVRDGFVEIASPSSLAPGQRVWAYCARDGDRAPL